MAITKGGIKARLRKLLNIPSLQMAPEREEELINKFAGIISRFGLEMPASLFGAPLVPTSTIFSQTVLVTFAPYLEMLGIPGFEYTALFMKKENVKRLLNKIEELKKARSGEDW